MTNEVKKLKDEIKIWEEQSLKKLEETSLNLERIKTLENCVEILTEQVGREKELLIKVKQLEDDLAKERLSYTCLRKRTDRAEGKLNIIKLTLNNEEK